MRKRKEEPDLIAFYNTQQGNRSGPFFIAQSQYGWGPRWK